MAMVILSPTQETEYAAWVQQHPQGFVINASKNGAGAMFWHRADCGTIQPYKDTRLVEGDNLKVCSLDPGALVLWALSRGGMMNFCQECRGKWLRESATT